MAATSCKKLAHTHLQQVAILLEIECRIDGVGNEQGQDIGGHRFNGEAIGFVHKQFMIDACEI